jgi:hypothetical protein
VVRTSADRIRERIKKTVQDIIEVGNELLAVKDGGPGGQFRDLGDSSSKLLE